MPALRSSRFLRAPEDADVISAAPPTSRSLLTPVATAALLGVEILRYRRHIRQESGTHSFRSFRMVAFAIFLVLESLAVNLLILSQLRMR